MRTFPKKTLCVAGACQFSTVRAGLRQLNSSIRRPRATKKIRHSPSSWNMRRWRLSPGCGRIATLLALAFSCAFSQRRSRCSTGAQNPPHASALEGGRNVLPGDFEPTPPPPPALSSVRSEITDWQQTRELWLVARDVRWTWLGFSSSRAGEHRWPRITRLLLV